MSTLQLGVTLSCSSPMFLPSHSLTPRNGFPAPKNNSLKNPFRLAHCICRTYSHGDPRMTLFKITCTATSPNLNKVCSFFNTNVTHGLFFYFWVRKGGQKIGFWNLAFLNLQSTDVVVEEKSVSVILLAGGKGKRMGVSTYSAVLFLWVEEGKNLSCCSHYLQLCGCFNFPVFITCVV